MAHYVGPYGASFFRFDTIERSVGQSGDDQVVFTRADDAVIEKMDETIEQTFNARMEHEIMRILNGWGG